MAHFSLDAVWCRLRQEATTLEGTGQMLMDSMSLDRVLVAAVLASLAIAVAFGPELRRALARLRNRRIADEVPALGAEPQQS
jgi:hypothetical protein